MCTKVPKYQNNYNDRKREEAATPSNRWGMSKAGTPAIAGNSQSRPADHRWE
jgi:hypothetical protein